MLTSYGRPGSPPPGGTPAVRHSWNRGELALDDLPPKNVSPCRFLLRWDTTLIRVPVVVRPTHGGATVAPSSYA